jgi:mRNA interferase RelE/StbE
LAYSVAYKKSVQRDLKKLPRSEVRRVLDQIEEELSKNAESYSVLKGRFVGLRKYRVGDFRVIYAVLGNDVVILRIGHRKDVYKKEITPL